MVNVFPDAPFVAITLSWAVPPKEVLIVEIPFSPASVIPGFTVNVIGIEVVAPSESVAVTVS
jgi:hypothetical protein